MRSFLPPLSAALAACAPTPQEAAVREAAPTSPAASVMNEGAVTQAAPGPIPEPVSAADNPFPGTSSSTADDAAAGDAEADAFVQGRRIVSTAFVRLGPGGHLLVTMRDRREVALRDVTMEKRQFCGTGLDAQGARRCYPYADVAAARAVDAPVGAQPVPADGVAAREVTPDRPR
jgi:hypothetical protein